MEQLRAPSIGPLSELVLVTSSYDGETGNKTTINMYGIIDTIVITSNCK